MKAITLVAAGIAVLAGAVSIAMSKHESALPERAVAPIPQLDDVAALERKWSDAENLCRGAYTPQPKACAKRDRIVSELRKKNRCFQYEDERVFPAQYQWHDCGEAHPAGWAPDPIISPPPVAPQPLITADQYKRIRNGMTYPQIVRFLNSEGEERMSDEVQGMGLKIVVWKNPDGSNFTGQFQNGWLTMKSQIGLR